MTRKHFAKAVAKAKAAERGEESARRDAGMVSNDPRSAAHGGVA